MNGRINVQAERWHQNSKKQEHCLKMVQERIQKTYFPIQKTLPFVPKFTQIQFIQFSASPLMKAHNA